MGWYWGILLALALAPLAYNWLVVPLIVGKKQNLALHPKWEPTTIEHLTREAQQFISGLITQFADAGFSTMANLHHAGATPGTASVQVLLVHRTSGDTASIVAVEAKNMRSLTFAIISRFADHSTISTGVTAGIGLFPRDPTNDSVTAPWVSDARTLLEFHGRRLHALGKEKVKRVAADEGNAIQYLTENWDRELRRFVSCGYMFRDENAGVCRYTLKGRYLACWKLMQPIKKWRIKLRNRHARRQWMELGMGGWRFVPVPTTFQAFPGELPAADVARNMENPNEINYEVKLQDGEFRIEHRGVSLIVRMGGMTIVQYIVRRWITLAWYSFISIFLARIGFRFAHYYFLFGWDVARALTPKSLYVLGIFMLLTACWESIRIRMDISQLCGTFMLVANTPGLNYQKVLSRRPPLQIARTDFQVLSVRLVRLLGFLRFYAIQASCHDGRSYRLLPSRDRPALERVRREIAKAMGIERDLIPPADLMGAAGPIQEISAPSRMQYPALDGLRGSAILLVLICHYSSLLPKSFAAAGIFENGWIGVDQFFVLSGFLITGILFDAKATHHYFRNFYARRILRIFPLYYGFLAAVILLLLILKFTSNTQFNSNEGPHQLWIAQPWLWTYTANFWMAMQKAWTDWTEMIMHLWSLSVEEQFYLVWPLAVFSFSHRNLLRICTGVFIGALLTRLILTAGGTNWFTLYILTPTRADSLAAGAFLALLLRTKSGEQLARRLFKYLGAIAVLLILLVAAGFDPTRHPWLRDLLYTFLAVFFTALLFWSIDPESLYGIPKRFYENRMLRAVGGYSYGIYVFHLPLMYLANYIFKPAGESWIESLMLISLNVILTFSIAFISFHVYEKQFLKLKRYFPERIARHPDAIKVR